MEPNPQIVEQLLEVLRPYTRAGQTLGPDTDLTADLGLDSPRVLDLVLEVEERFDVSVPMNVLPDVRTVRDLALAVERLLVERP